MAGDNQHTDQRPVNAMSEPISNDINGDQDRKDHTLDKALSNLSLSSQAIHADDFLNVHNTDVAPGLHVSTTFRYQKNPDDLIPTSQQDVRNKSAIYKKAHTQSADPNLSS